MQKFSTIWLILNLYILKILISCTKIFLKPIKEKKIRSVLYLENFPIENSGYQYRVEKWAKKLTDKGYYTVIKTTNKDISSYDFNQMNLGLYLVRSMWLRYCQICNSRKFQFVVVRRELLLYNDYGNLFMDKFLLYYHPSVILDFDDDIISSKNEPKKLKGFIPILLQEHSSKFSETLLLYNNFIVASDYLKQLVANYRFDSNYRISVIPTCVDYLKFEKKNYIPKQKLTLGWIGGNQNYFLLDSLIPVLDKLFLKYDFDLLVIGGNKYNKQCSFHVAFKKWELRSEINSLYNIDIGLMPLDRSKISKGKGGFKLIQYMGIGIVSIASNVTINKQIIDDKINSFLANSDEEWYALLEQILIGKINLSAMGDLARQKIQSKYTFDCNLNKYLNIFQ
jgi:glycosyltransferase involved in cell wall biosynthesis